ncbi:MAG: GNAT family N-acetyltransferase [Bacteroidetes bacterium]|nr:GNAT family N-acetyltransferase [Bacteroidota bacterium]MCL2301865.1 GNAT family N-acetyltransferase [Lentimicrobiaceae bacterium]
MNIRFATKEDVPAILHLIKAIADYEKLLHEVTATEEILYDSLFVKKAAEVLLGEYDGKIIGFALFFHNFSTFTGKRGLYLEDLFVLPEYRHQGFGKQFFFELMQLAQQRECGRMEWICLDWNAPAIRFYTDYLGAIPMDEWTVYRLSEKKIADFFLR